MCLRAGGSVSPPSCLRGPSPRLRRYGANGPLNYHGGIYTWKWVAGEPSNVCYRQPLGLCPPPPSPLRYLRLHWGAPPSLSVPFVTSYPAAAFHWQVHMPPFLFWGKALLIHALAERVRLPAVAGLAGARFPSPLFYGAYVMKALPPRRAISPRHFYNIPDAPAMIPRSLTHARGCGCFAWHF